MSPIVSRLRWPNASHDAYKVLFALEASPKAPGLSKALLDLVKLRASQINRCAFCIDMHWKDLRAAGESEQRLYGLNAWRESPYYTDRERAALEWAEAVTLLTDGFVPDAVYEAVRPHFNDRELVDLTLAVIAINAWNRMNVAFRTEAGHYTPGMFEQHGKGDDKVRG
jgi:AhpD family alkylhydroperoxidase